MHFMKRTLLCSLFATSVIMWATCSGRAQDPSFEVKIGSPTAVFTAGSVVRLDVTLINNSQQALMFSDPRCNPVKAGITVRDDRQTIVKLRDELQGPIRTCGFGDFLEPTKSVTLSLNIARWFDLGRPGRYFIQYSPTGVGNGNVRKTNQSNIFEMHVVQGN